MKTVNVKSSWNYQERKKIYVYIPEKLIPAVIARRTKLLEFIQSRHFALHNEQANQNSIKLKRKKKTLIKFTRLELILVNNRSKSKTSFSFLETFLAAFVNESKRGQTTKRCNFLCNACRWPR